MCRWGMCADSIRRWRFVRCGHRRFRLYIVFVHRGHRGLVFFLGSRSIRRADWYYMRVGLVVWRQRSRIQFRTWRVWMVWRKRRCFVQRLVSRERCYRLSQRHTVRRLCKGICFLHRFRLGNIVHLRMHSFLLGRIGAYRWCHRQRGSTAHRHHRSHQNDKDHQAHRLLCWRDHKVGYRSWIGLCRHSCTLRHKVWCHYRCRQIYHRRAFGTCCYGRLDQCHIGCPVYMGRCCPLGHNVVLQRCSYRSTLWGRSCRRHKAAHSVSLCRPGYRRFRSHTRCCWRRVYRSLQRPRRVWVHKSCCCHIVLQDHIVRLLYRRRAHTRRPLGYRLWC